MAIFHFFLLGTCPPSSGDVSCPLISTQVVREWLTQPGQWGSMGGSGWAPLLTIPPLGLPFARMGEPGPGGQQEKACLGVRPTQTGAELACTWELHRPINSLPAAASLIGVPVTAPRRVTNRGRDVRPLFTTTWAVVVVVGCWGSIGVFYYSRAWSRVSTSVVRGPQYLHHSGTELDETTHSWAPTSKSESPEARPERCISVKHCRGVPWHPV